MPDNPEPDNFTDIDNTLILQRRLRFQAITGILVTALVVGGIASFQFYQSRQRSVVTQLQKELQFGAFALGAKLNEYRNISWQITSRTSIRNTLQRYNRHEIDLDRLRSDSRSKLADAMRLSPEIVGITRLDQQHAPVIQVGNALPEDTWPQDHRTAQSAIGLPARQNDSWVLAVSAAILTPDSQRVGTDLVYFDIRKSTEIIDHLSTQFPFDNRIFFALDDSGRTQLFHLGESGESFENFTSDSVSGLLAGPPEDRIFNFQDAARIEKTLVKTAVPGAGWQLIFEADSSRVTQVARSDTGYLFASIMLLMIAGIVITNRLVKPTVGAIQIDSKALRKLYARNQQLLEQEFRNKRLFDDILNHTPAVIFIKDLDGRYLHANQSFAAERGLTVDEIIGKTDRDLHPPEIAEQFRANDSAAIASNSPVVVEEKLEIDAEMHTFVTTKFPLKDADGRSYALCGISTDVTEIKQSEELRHALQTAVAANQAKSIFLANMSHELRTPLHGILSYSELGKNRLESVNRERLGKYFEYIHLSGKRLLILLNDLLDLSKLEAGKVELVYRSYDLGMILNDCIEEQSPGLREKSLEITRSYNGIDTLIECDREKIFQVIRNILSNAIKFSRSGGMIEIQLDDCQLDSDSSPVEAIEISVTDDGEGVDGDDLEKIFDKFAQSKNPHPGGTGLGLSISREIVLQHQGEIWAENDKDRGAKLNIRLPRKRPFDQGQV